MFSVVNILKFDINCTFFFFGDYFQLTKPKTKKRPWGFAPNPTHFFCGGRRGMWQNLSTFPWAECWVDSKASRVKCTTASPLTPFHLLGCSKTIRSGRSRKPVKACEANRVAAWPLLVGGDPTLCGWGAGVKPAARLHPCHVANAGVGSAHGLTSPQGARSRGVDVPKALILGVMVL